MRAGFEDYRAAATIDLEDDRADRDTKITAPTLVLWGRGAEPAGRRHAGRLEGAVRVHGRRPRRAGLGPLHPRGAAAGGGRRGPRVRGRGGVASDADDERDRPVD